MAHKLYTENRGCQAIEPFVFCEGHKKGTRPRQKKGQPPFRLYMLVCAILHVVLVESWFVWLGAALIGLLIPVQVRFSSQFGKLRDQVLYCLSSPIYPENAWAPHNIGGNSYGPSFKTNQRSLSRMFSHENVLLGTSSSRRHFPLESFGNEIYKEGNSY